MNITYRGKPVPTWFIALTLGLIAAGFLLLCYVD